jgi:hypothetical protein
VYHQAYVAAHSCAKNAHEWGTHLFLLRSGPPVSTTDRLSPMDSKHSSLSNRILLMTYEPGSLRMSNSQVEGDDHGLRVLIEAEFF